MDSNTPTPNPQAHNALETARDMQLSCDDSADGKDPRAAQCPKCDHEVLAVIEVNSLGTDTYNVVEGEVHREYDAGEQGIWRLYCHRPDAEAKP